jgi:hypothetical protein
MYVSEKASFVAFDDAEELHQNLDNSWQVVEDHRAARSRPSVLVDDSPAEDALLNYSSMFGRRNLVAQFSSVHRTDIIRYPVNLPLETPISTPLENADEDAAPSWGPAHRSYAVEAPPVVPSPAPLEAPPVVPENTEEQQGFNDIPMCTGRRRRACKTARLPVCRVWMGASCRMRHEGETEEEHGLRTAEKRSSGGRVRVRVAAKPPHSELLILGEAARNAGYTGLVFEMVR